MCGRLHPRWQGTTGVEIDPVLELVDTHTHIYLDAFDRDRKEAIDRAVAAGVGCLLMPNVDLQTMDAMMGVAEAFPARCIPMMGLHPTAVRPGYEAALEIMESRTRTARFAAIGETGLDLHWDKRFLKEQQEALAWQARLALEQDLPLVLHSRKSLNELFALLRGFKGSGLRGVFHCFPGNIPDAMKAIELGFMLGIGGVVTYPNSTMARVVEAVELQHLLLETDAPYLPPVPYRGKRNESAHVLVIARRVAEIKGVSLEEVARQTTANAHALFALDNWPG